MPGSFLNFALSKAKDGPPRNSIYIAGTSFGLKRNITENISILPEVGAYWYEGAINSVRTSGPVFQFGLMLSTNF